MLKPTTQRVFAFFEVNNPLVFFWAFSPASNFGLNIQDAAELIKWASQFRGFAHAQLLSHLATTFATTLATTSGSTRTDGFTLQLSTPSTGWRFSFLLRVSFKCFTSVALRVLGSTCRKFNFSKKGRKQKQRHFCRRATENWLTNIPKVVKIHYTLAPQHFSPIYLSTLQLSQ